MGWPVRYRRSWAWLSSWLRSVWWWVRVFIRVGETGCQRIVSPFSRRRMRHWSWSRSVGVSVSAPPRRHAGSVWSRSRRVSRSGSLPVVLAVWLMSASWWAGMAWRGLVRRRGFGTGAAGLLGWVMSWSVTAWW